DRDGDERGCGVAHLDGVVSRPGVDEQLVAGVASGDVRREGKSGDVAAGAVRTDVHVVHAVGPVNDNRVRLRERVTVVRQVDRRLGETAARDVVEGDRVGATEGGQVERLDRRQVHPDVAEVTREQCA